MMDILTVAGFWLIGLVAGYLLGRFHSFDHEAEALDRLAKALDRHDWELEQLALDDREYMVVGDPPVHKPS